jgi:hypothetical protein
MPDQEQLAIMQEHAMREILDTIGRHDPEAGARLDRFGGLPVSATRSSEHAVFVAEAVAALAKLVDQQLTPKPRGRPRKDNKTA